MTAIQPAPTCMAWMNALSAARARSARWRAAATCRVRSAETRAWQWAGASMRQSPTRLPDYADTAGRRRSATLSVSGHQPGDPTRAAAAIAAVVDTETPPLRLLLGTDALTGARARLDRLRAEIDAHETLTKSADLVQA